MRRICLLSMALCWLQLTCLSQPPEADIRPPAVLSFGPQGEAVDPDAAITVEFSEPVDESALVDELVVVVEEALVDGAFLQDFDRPPLTARRAELLLPCRLSADEDGARLMLQPVEPLAFGQAYLVVVSAAVCDLAGNPLVDELRTDERGRIVGQQTHVTHRFRVRSAPEDPPAGLVFSEVLANPEGTEREGEYLEVFNLGQQPVDLVDWRLDDTGGESSGDRLGPCQEGGQAVVAPGSAALLVGGEFVDPPDLATGTGKICTEGSTLTPRGLKNAGGEVLVLSDAEGNEVDRYGGWVKLSGHEGCAAVRLDLEAPDGPDNWAVPEAQPCRSPGWVE